MNSHHLPAELWTKIAGLACTDGGLTGCSLSLVSRYMHSAAQPARYHSVLINGDRDADMFASRVDKLSPTSPIRHLVLYANQVDTGAGEEVFRRILHHASATLYTLHWYSPLYFEFFHHIIPSLTFPALDYLSIPTLTHWQALSSTPFPSLQILHLSYHVERDCVWKTIAQLAPSVSAVSFLLFGKEDLPKFLRVLLRAPEQAAPASGSPSPNVHDVGNNTSSSYAPGSAEEIQAKALAARLPRLKRVAVACFLPARGADASVQRALDDIAAACADRGDAEGGLYVWRFRAGSGDGKHLFLPDWMAIAEGSDGPWFEAPSKVTVGEAQYVAIRLHAVRAVDDLPCLACSS